MKAYTDLEQSKKLAEILPLESADMYWRSLNLNGHISWSPHIKRLEPPLYDFEHYAPCWSLAALLDVLPKGTRLLKSSTDDIYHCDCPKCNIDEWFDNPVDACYGMIIKLSELNLL